jgi:hypothetical protein
VRLLAVNTPSGPEATVKNIGVTNPISVGGTTRADELCYDPTDNLIMIASPAESPPFVTFGRTAKRVQ